MWRPSQNQYPSCTPPCILLIDIPVLVMLFYWTRLKIEMMSYCCQVIYKEFMDITTSSDKARSIVYTQHNYTKIQQLQLHDLIQHFRLTLKTFYRHNIQSNPYFFFYWQTTTSDTQQQHISETNINFFFILKTISKYWTCLEHSLIILRLSFNYWFPLWIQVHVLLWWQSTRIMLRLVYRLTHRSYIIFKVNKDENILYF